jgi:hypothetical protein
LLVTVPQGALISSANMGALAELSNKFEQNLQNFGSNIMAAAGGSSEVSANCAHYLDKTSL